MSKTTTSAYRPYWTAWFILLVITVAMVFIGSKAILALGMTLKAAIIAMFFMHLGREKKGLIYSVLIGVLVMTAFLVVLLVPDGAHMNPGYEKDAGEGWELLPPSPSETR